MHLLATATGSLDGAAVAADLGQSPGDLVVLSAADSELAALAAAHAGLPCPKPSLRLANILALQHNYSVDLYVEKTLAGARLIVVRLLGGASYWRYGVDEIEALARRAGIGLALLPGDAGHDPQLTARSTLALADCGRLHRHLACGGHENVSGFLRFCAHLLDRGPPPEPAVAPPRAGLYRSSEGDPGRPLAAIVFYRSVLDGAQAAPIDSLIDALARRGIDTRAIFVAGLKDPESTAFIRERLADRPPDIILNATAFAVGSAEANPFLSFDCPVLQVVLAGSGEADWRAGTQGLGPRDLAMNVVLPELDGRIMTRAVSFKADQAWDAATECRLVTYRPLQDRIDFVADLSANWIRLRRAETMVRHLAIILANYPNRDGRIANGVGYDTPASTVAILKALQASGYSTGAFPETGNGLIEALQAGPTNAPGSSSRTGPGVRFAIEDYLKHWKCLPESVREQIELRWGAPQDDPFCTDSWFTLPVRLYGNVALAIQPARGYNIDPKATFHDPALVPPHGYLAVYFWLRHGFKAHAVIHNGKHGNLEWLPGKATALSASCFPEVALGPVPQLYPFIVNDPGEGAQAKRRTSAVIVDHLTPALARAETYGPLKDLEALVDEYYLALGLDRRRLVSLRGTIMDLARGHRLNLDAGFSGDEESDLRRLDAYLCDLKEAQIRDGLHVFGASPEGELETALLVALTRIPRGLGEGGDQSLIRALSRDLRFGDFDPLTCSMADPWTGPHPPCLESITSDPWRTNGDTVERLEMFAAQLLSSSRRKPGPNSPREDISMGISTVSVGPGFRRDDELKETIDVLDRIETAVRPALRACGPNELASLLKGLDGRFVAPGPSGAPTRGRLDVLPTGRNFYSIDNRTVPTPTAWTLGQRSAEDLLARHFQDFGQYPKFIGLSAWGTSNMRTGGDDIAQALALIGAKPVWEPASWRVTGYEVVPIAKLGRPRVDVTLRISGFFRDAFPAQIELLDRAIRAVGALEEDEADNPIAARMAEESRSLEMAGASPKDARRAAGHRVFGSKPGSYGAGLQALIDEKLWAGRADLARAYVAWGAYAYGARDAGTFDEQVFTERLRHIEAVVHNQDNREHDLLDSDDYYQFEGGMAAAVEVASGRQPRVYHNDHSRPERPVIRTLEEEVGRVVRSRVVNPKWIAGVKRHGYKGAFEIAATVDYMFAFAATTGAVKTHHFDLAYDSYLADEETRGFIAANNAAALREIAERFDEAAARGLWTPRSNSAYDLIRTLREPTAP